MRVLVLEDQGTASNYLIKYISEKARHTPVLARSIKDGKSILEESLKPKEPKFDCIVADINMPADGLTTGEQNSKAFSRCTNSRRAEASISCTGALIRSRSR
jgi:DNA-binding response OmpR family regulator